MGDLIKFTFAADASAVNQALANMQQNCQNFVSSVGEGFSAIGLEAVLGLFDKLKGAVGQLGQMFSSCMHEASALEEVGTRLGVMLNNAGSGDALASSLQRMATNGIVPLQELEKAAAALTHSLSDPQEIAEWVGVFADIAAGSDVTADRLAKMTARLDDMGKAEFTELANAGIPIYAALAKVTGKTTEEIVKLSSQGKISTSALLEAFKALTAEGEKYHNLNAEMSNTTSGSWDTLAASIGEVLAVVGDVLNNAIRPGLQWCSEALQEWKELFAVLVGYVMTFAGIWGGLKAASFAKSLWGCVAAMSAMKTAGQGLLGIFRSIGKVGWMLVITTAVEALAALYDKFFGSGGEVVPPQAPPEDFVAKAQEKEKEQADKKQREALNAAATVDAFDSLLKEGGAPADYDVAEGRRLAAKRENDKKHTDARVKALEDLQKMEQARINKKQADAFRNELGAFEQLHVWQQKQILRNRLAQVGIHSGHGYDVAKMKSMLDTQMANAAAAGNTTRWQMLQGVGKYVEAYESAAARRQKDTAQKTQGMQELQERERLLRARENGNEAEVRRLQATQEALRLAQELESWGLGKSEARARASSIIAREYNLDTANQKQSPAVSREFVADSLASIGGGGRGFSLGEAQLQIAREQVTVLVNSQQILADINKKMEYIDNGTIKVVP